MPKVSIIIAVFNVEKYLRECLDSVVNQTLKDIEIICVDDCSTDNSVNILKEYAEKDNRIKMHLQKENQGPGIARNQAIEIATGDYVMILDPDDWLEPYACELAYNKISKNLNDMVFFGFQRYYEESKVTKIDREKLEPFFKVIDNDQINLANLQNDYFKTAFTWSQIYSRKFLIDNDIKYSETYLQEDLVFFIKAIVHASTVSVLDIPIYNYRIRKTSLSLSLSKNWYDLILNRKIALNIICNSEKVLDYIYPFLVYLINTSSFWDLQISNISPNLQKDYYNETRKIFIDVNKKYEIEKIAQYINYKKFQKICKSSWNRMLPKIILQKIFQAANTGEYKIVTILGLKIRLKKYK